MLTAEHLTSSRSLYRQVAPTKSSPLALRGVCIALAWRSWRRAAAEARGPRWVVTAARVIELAAWDVAGRCWRTEAHELHPGVALYQTPEAAMRMATRTSASCPPARTPTTHSPGAHPVTTADQLAALEVLGRTWLAEIRGEPGQHMHPCLACSGGRWRGPDLLAFPHGLTLEQALGFTLAVRWVEAHDSGRDIYHAPVVATSSTTSSNRPIWSVCLPGVGQDRNLSAAEALPVTRALLTVRRILWPVRPWGRRDQIAETLELHARAMEADLRGPAPIERVFPPTFLSDLGRNWR